MLFSTFPELIANCTDANGCIRWSTAHQAAKDHGIVENFITEYGGHGAFGGVDAGEFLIWMGY
jgi:hypothetical protein